VKKTTRRSAATGLSRASRRTGGSGRMMCYAFNDATGVESLNPNPCNELAACDIMRNSRSGGGHVRAIHRTSEAGHLLRSL
jgi:hypothetical protein